MAGFPLKTSEKRKGRYRYKQYPPFPLRFSLEKTGNVLFSRAVSSQVLSALRGLTSVFGMGTGGSLSPLPPEILFSFLSSSFPENCTDPFPLRFLCLRFRLTYGFRFLTLRFFYTLLRLLLFSENSP